MKIKNGFTLHQIGDEHIIMHNGTGNVDFSNIISLNPTATAFGNMWKEQISTPTPLPISLRKTTK